MEFLSSPIHTYSDETFDDAFLQLPREMDFEVNNDSWGGLSYSMHEEEDLNDGMYGVWNVKHPWSINNNASSLYNSNLHLDFIGGDPESATMVNPNFVLPNGFRVKVKYDDDSSLSEGQTSTSQSTQVSEKTETENTTTDLSDDGEEEVTSQVKKIKHIFLSAKETTVNGADSSTTVAKSPSSKNSIRVLKPSVVETNDLSMSNKLTSPQIKNDSPHLKTLSTNKSYRSSKYDFYYQNEHFYPKPAFSYSCLIAMALKNSKHGCLPVAEIYNFMCNHFPYFKTAPNGWKNSVRHNLSLNKCFEKIDKPAGSTHRKGCLWALNPSKAARLEEEVHKCARKDALSIRKAMEYPEHLELLERGELKSLYDTEEGVCEDEEDIDTNEDDTEGEDLEPNDEVCDDSEEHHEKAPAMNISEPQELPEFRIEVDDSIYDELMGTIKTEERRFAVTDSSSNVTKENAANATKKVKKVYIEMNNGAGEKATSMAKNSEAFDHYDINNFLRLENEMKTTGKRSARFTKPLVPNSAMKQIKFKTWD